MTAYIKSISYYLPENKLTNEELSTKFPEWSAEKIYSKLGIEERAITEPDELASDIGIKAAEKLFQDEKTDRGQIDFILFCTQSPDYLVPPTACLLQDKLNIPTSSGALDFNLGCSGFVYGLTLAKGLIESKAAKNILLITAETYSKFIHASDRGNRSIFGDAATATLISDNGIAKIKNFSLGTDGKGANNLIVKKGGMRNPKFTIQKEEELSEMYDADSYLKMQGAEIFNFTLTTVPQLIAKILEVNGKKFEEIDFFIFHQANKYILENLQRKCRIPEKKFLTYLKNTGNTVSSTIPITLKEALLKQTIHRGHTVLLAGFGVGYSWGGTILQF